MAKKKKMNDKTEKDYSLEDWKNMYYNIVEKYRVLQDDHEKLSSRVAKKLITMAKDLF